MSEEVQINLDQNQYHGSTREYGTERGRREATIPVFRKVKGKKFGAIDKLPWGPLVILRPNL